MTRRRSVHCPECGNEVGVLIGEVCEPCYQKARRQSLLLCGGAEGFVDYVYAHPDEGWRYASSQGNSCWSNLLGECVEFSPDGRATYQPNA